MPSVTHVIALLQDAGFTDVVSTPYWVERSPVDLFLYAGKHHPELYLDPEVRRGISSFASVKPGELAAGLDRLQADIGSGKFRTSRVR
jgi:hypothetical protein